MQDTCVKFIKCIVIFFFQSQKTKEFCDSGPHFVYSDLLISSMQDTCVRFIKCMIIADFPTRAGNSRRHPSPRVYEEMGIDIVGELKNLDLTKL